LFLWAGLRPFLLEPQLLQIVIALRRYGPVLTYVIEIYQKARPILEVPQVVLPIQIPPELSTFVETILYTHYVHWHWVVVQPSLLVITMHYIKVMADKDMPATP
jgi:hypothetical protein